ncbi:MAG: hypothetical protein LBJ08_03395 [Bifidobacteriaceae bacterium]|jgi:hypothetical protein|nr:hypothetical protein [Bifidobacteriaceae bacterium]
MTATVPIRVPVATRDTLKEMAAQQGTTIPKALARLVDKAWWDAAFEAERRATVLDGLSPAALAEDAEWDAISDEAIC